MKTEKRIKGDKGEKAVTKFLKRNKFKITERNYSLKCGEIDIIAENRELILFVEVKTREEGQMLAPSFSVDKKKKIRILKTAMIYMQKTDCQKQPRFDIAEVISDDKGRLSINYIDNSFGMESYYAR